MHSEKTLSTMRAVRAVKRITFNPSEAYSGTLYVHMSNLTQMRTRSSCLALWRSALTSTLLAGTPITFWFRMVVKVAATILEETVGYDIYKTFRALFLPGERRDNKVRHFLSSGPLQ